MIQAYEKLCVEKADLETELGEMVGAGGCCWQGPVPGDIGVPFPSPWQPLGKQLLHPMGPLVPAPGLGGDAGLGGPRLLAPVMATLGGW